MCIHSLCDFCLLDCCDKNLIFYNCSHIIVRKLGNNRVCCSVIWEVSISSLLTSRLLLCAIYLLTLSIM